MNVLTADRGWFSVIIMGSIISLYLEILLRHMFLACLIENLQSERVSEICWMPEIRKNVIIAYLVTKPSSKSILENLDGF